MTDEDRIVFIESPRHAPRAPAPRLPLLQHQTSLAPAVWLQDAMTTFGTSVAAFLPGTFAAYARLYHPFEIGGLVPVAPGRWRELAARYGGEIGDPASAEAFAYSGVPDAQAPRALSLAVIDVLVQYLGAATATPEECFFALWNGYGGSIVPHDLQPQLELPNREYHVFAGPVAAARSTFDPAPFTRTTANLWWPADHAWCVANEIDLRWSYVGGSERLIAGILADTRLDAEPTRADAMW